LKIPSNLRSKWGIYKNLLCGVTTVVNHGDKIKIHASPINIVQTGQSLHSVGFEKHWKWKLNNLFKLRSPCVIHSGEGIDEASTKEIDQLIKFNLLGRDLIGIHGIAMTGKQSSHYLALVWCPQSNYFLFNNTADIKTLKKHVPVLFGTDSTLTSDWNIWNHIRTARINKSLNDAELFGSLSSEPAEIWDLNTGIIAPFRNADLVISKNKKDLSDFDSFYSNNPEDILMVICNGKIQMLNAELLKVIPENYLSASQYSCISFNNSQKLVPKDLGEIVNDINKYNSGIKFPFQFKDC
jgi:hypothetical protein